MRALTWLTAVFVIAVGAVDDDQGSKLSNENGPACPFSQFSEVVRKSHASRFWHRIWPWSRQSPSKAPPIFASDVVGAVPETTSTAETKFQAVWAAITKSSTPATWFDTSALLGLFIESMEVSFEKGDWLPEDRKKLIHSVGEVAPVEWQPRPNDYSGLFESGAKYGIIRLSSAKKPSFQEKSWDFTPGFGLKLFRDGVHSGNTVAMYSLDGQPSANFFANRFRNHVLGPKSFALKLVAVKFRQATQYERFIGLSDMAAFDDKGQETLPPRMPYELIFEPSPELSERAEQYIKRYGLPEDKWTSQFRLCIPGRLLYRVYARKNPWTRDEDLEHVADLVQTGEFRPSEVADRHLSFGHTKMDEDFKYRPEWEDFYKKQ